MKPSECAGSTRFQAAVGLGAVSISPPSKSSTSGRSMRPSTTKGPAMVSAYPVHRLQRGHDAEADPGRIGLDRWRPRRPRGRRSAARNHLVLEHRLGPATKDRNGNSTEVQELVRGQAREAARIAVAGLLPRATRFIGGLSRNVG
ncbi:MAG: hypothetical protein R3F30_11705 [Planctomycetota bacterium]